MKKAKLISIIASIGALTIAAPCVFTSCSQPKAEKSATKEEFLAKYQEFLANFKAEPTHPNLFAAFSASDMFNDKLIDDIEVEATTGDKCCLKIYVRDGGTEPFEMNCGGMELTEIEETLRYFEKNCKDCSPVTFYSVIDDQISMYIKITYQPEYGEVRVFNACELVINSKGYMTKYVNIPPIESPLGYEAILNLIYYPY